MAVQTRIQIRRGTLAQWVASAQTLGNGILYQGEIGYETDTGRFKIGDGSTAWSSLSYSNVLPSNFIAGSGVTLTQGTNGSTLTIGLSNPTIQVSNITDFAEGVDDRVAALLQAGTNISLNYNDNANTLTINSSLGLEEVQDAIGTYVVAGSGISVSYDDPSGYTTVSLSDPTIQLADVTDLTTSARNFLLTPSSSNLRTLVSDETGTGSLVFGTNPTISSGILAGTSSMNVFNTTATTVNAFGGASTALNIGGGGGDGSVVNIAVGSTPGVGTRNINIATGSWMGGETNINIGIASGGTTTVRNNLVANGNLTVGGSGLVASNINNFDTAVRASRLDQMSAPTSDVSLNSRKITNLADPTNDQDAATKAYVDAARSGLDVKQSVRVATTTNLLTLFGLLTIDGVTLVAGDRVLVKDQTGAQQPFNGIYVVSAGNWSRATDADSSAEVTAGMFTFVTEGTVNADSGWVLTTNDTITLDTTDLTFAQFSGAGQITAGAGMTKSGNTLDVGTASSSRIVVNADSIDLATVSQSNSSGSAGVNFAQSVSVDSYGRVTGVTSADVRDATTSVKGIASFDSGDFSVTSGAVSIKASGVGNSQLENSSVTVGSTNISLGSTSTTLAGLTSVTSSSFVGDLTGNSSTSTTLQTSRTINGTSFNGSADITITFVDGGTP